ncbi:hypothetical protein [Nocardia beijingensis]|uniref:Uncharacterized protein n=1 Tax=Nocardia beijingensis TaxID=95162 RepID=A0ABW7WRI3_9NOCA
MDRQSQPLGSLRIEVKRTGCRRLRRFTQDWLQAVWAIGGNRGLGAPSAQKLADDGVEFWKVPAKLARRVRTLSTGQAARTTKAMRCRSVTALKQHALRSVYTDETVQVLCTFTECRDDLTHTANPDRQPVVRHADPVGASRAAETITAEAASELLRSVRPGTRPPNSAARRSRLVGEFRRPATASPSSQDRHMRRLV